MGSSGEDFLLKWNDHHSLFFAGAEELCHSDEYTDCTLAAGQKFFSAHKLVLSICSPFFRALFKRLGPNNKTVIFLKDVEPVHLELLLEYMYKGEIKVQESELVNVLNAAQSLEVKGLTDNGQKSEPKPAKPEVPRVAAKRPSPAPVAVEPPKRPKPAMVKPAPPPVVIAPPPPAPPLVKEEQQEVIPITEESVESVEWEEGEAAPEVYDGEGGYAGEGNYAGGTVATGYEEMGGYEGEEYYGDEGVMAVGEGDDRSGDAVAICLLCGKLFSTKYNLKVHHRTVHEMQRSYKCTLCNRAFSQNSSLNRHMRNHHSIVANSI